MLERIAEIIKEQLNADGITITMDTSFEKDLEADSLDLFELVMTLEDEYGVEIPSEELENLTTVGEVIKYLESKGVEAGRHGLGGGVSSCVSRFPSGRAWHYRCGRRAGRLRVRTNPPGEGNGR